MDLRLGLPLGAWEIYGGRGLGRTQTKLTINADGVELDANRSYRYWVAGVAWRWGLFLFTLEQNRTGDYLDHIILAVAYRL